MNFELIYDAGESGYQVPWFALVFCIVFGVFFISVGYTPPRLMLYMLSNPKSELARRMFPLLTRRMFPLLLGVWFICIVFIAITISFCDYWKLCQSLRS